MFKSFDISITLEFAIMALEKLLMYVLNNQLSRGLQCGIC